MSDVVAVSAGQHDREWSSDRVGDQVMLGVELAAIDWTRLRAFPTERAQMRGIRQTCGLVEQAGGAKLSE
ncbi:hypothetical protein ABZU76_17820 [Amycolatopsis sp. NPDC005232]|uniref:hypothetical protein n=1 Tax=Amycolatopsis sp. NPDC005232 TaxID=3157027 RepID=UPI0033AE49C7